MLLQQALRDGMLHEMLHTMPFAIDSLRGYEPFIELMRPKGWVAG